MSAAELSTKRKRCSRSEAHLFMGTFTRRKSEIFLRRTRSGRYRSDPNPHRDRQRLDLTGFQLLTKKPRRNSSTQEVSALDIFSPFLVKDLRTRRVTSVSVNEETDGISCKAMGVKKTDSLIRNCLEDVKKLVDGFPLEKQHLEAGYSRFDFIKKGIVGDCFDGRHVREDENVEKLKSGLSSKKLEALGENCPQSTPPDAEICGAKLEAERNREAQIRDKISEKPSAKELQANKGRRSVLNPCSRVKLFKAPDSISYGRLLPYLMDIAKEYSDASEKGQSPKSEDGLEQSSSKEISVEETTRDCRLTKDHNREVYGGFNSVAGGCIGNSPMDDVPCCRGSADGNTKKLDNEMSCKDVAISKSCQDPPVVMTHHPPSKGNSAGVRSDETELKNGSKTEKTDALGSRVQDLKRLLQSPECHPCNDGVARQCSGRVHLFETEEMHSNMEHFLEAQRLNHIEPSLSNKEANCTCDLKEKVDNDGEVLDQVGNIFEGYILTTKPPNADFICERKGNASGGTVSDSLNHGVDHVITNSSSGNSQTNNGYSTDGLDSCTKGKQVLKSGRPQKLFKIPGSLNYRRMLHILTDITMDKPGSSRNGRLEEVKMSGNDNAPSSLRCHAGSSNIIPVGPETTILGPRDYNKQFPSSPDHIASFQMALASRQGLESPLELIASDDADTIDPSNGGQRPATSLSSFINSESLPKEESSKLVLSRLPDGTREDELQSSIGAKPIEAGPCLKEVPFDTEVPAVLLRKGILKRNPRGCRGICTCLNCSSFRLHAERAFEFSRNQMQDAEEVALNLIEELAYVRAMLQKSSVGADGQAVICINQVKEACRKSSKAEEIAKDRLNQMNYELSMHCRIPCGQGPRVKFANYVEKAIPTADLTNTRE